MLLGHRYYDASTGRFLSADPAQAGTNWYDYCQNNPMTKVDPSGLDSFDNYNPGGTNGQTTTFGPPATAPGNPSTSLTPGSPIQSTTVKLTNTGKGGTIIISITPPQGDQPPGAPTGTTGAGPGSGTILGTYPIGNIGPVHLLGSLGGSGKLDGSSTGTTFGGGLQIGRTTVTMTGTSTTTSAGKTTDTGTATIGYNPGGHVTVGVAQTGGTLKTGMTMLTVGYSG
jgi:hypothetical protein